jgi:hypothetical protein
MLYQGGVCALVEVKGWAKMGGRDSVFGDITFHDLVADNTCMSDNNDSTWPSNKHLGWSWADHVSAVAQPLALTDLHFLGSV